MQAPENPEEGQWAISQLWVVSHVVQMVSLLPGLQFRFTPTPEILLRTLRQKNSDGVVTGEDFLFFTVDNMLDFTPEQLVQMRTPGVYAKNQCCFFTTVEPSRNHRSGFDRRLPSGALWDQTSNGKIIAGCRSLTFYNGPKGSDSKSDWVMHEYHVADDNSTVLCHIYNRNPNAPHCTLAPPALAPPAPALSAPALSAPALSAPALSAPALSAPALSAPALSAPALSAPTPRCPLPPSNPSTPSNTSPGTAASPLQEATSVHLPPSASVYSSQTSGIGAHQGHPCPPSLLQSPIAATLPCQAGLGQQDLQGSFMGLLFLGDLGSGDVKDTGASVSWKPTGKAPPSLISPPLKASSLPKDTADVSQEVGQPQRNMGVEEGSSEAAVWYEAVEWADSRVNLESIEDLLAARDSMLELDSLADLHAALQYTKAWQALKKPRLV